jgi:hypothetical protein
LKARIPARLASLATVSGCFGDDPEYPTPHDNLAVLHAMQDRSLKAEG